MNFVIPSDYARGMLRTSTTQPLTSIYEPRESEPASKPATEEPKPVPTALEQTRAEPPEDIRKQGLLPFLASKRFKWTEEDAKSTLGDALVHRFSYDNNRTTDGDIYSYNDPTKTARMLELCFDTKTKKLRWASVFLAAKGTKDDSKRMFGDKFAARKNPDGSSFHVYSDKQMNVYFDKSGLLGFIQVY